MRHKAAQQRPEYLSRDSEFRVQKHSSENMQYMYIHVHVHIVMYIHVCMSISVALFAYLVITLNVLLICDQEVRIHVP